jgi:uncharacterized protein YfiM (DUF2279 family)
MRWLFRLIVVLVVLVPVGLIALIVVSIETRPLVPTQMLMSAANIERAKRLVHEQDPRKLESGQIKTVRVNAEELNLVFNHILNRFGPGGAVTTLSENRLNLSATLNLKKFVPESYLNSELEILSDGQGASIEKLKIGQLAIPAPLLRGLSAIGGQYLKQLSRSKNANDMIRVFEIHPQHVEVTYAWEADIVDAVRNQIISPEDRDKLRHYNKQLAQIIEEHGGQITFANLVEELFSNVHGRSLNGGAEAENGAAIIVLGAYVNGRKLTALVPQASSWITPQRVRLTIHGRHDFVQHFATSAALAVAGGSVVAETIGLVKEIDDADGGSGFSFKDLAADKAGTRFGQTAVESYASAIGLQRNLSRGVNDKMLIPDTSGLEENLADTEFERRYGGIGGAKYKTVVRNIDVLLSNSELYR